MPNNSNRRRRRRRRISPTLSFNTEKANWPEFQRILQHSKETRSKNIHEHCQNILDEIKKNAALKTIANNSNRRNNNRPKRTNKKYWWNEACEAAVEERKKALKKVKKESSERNIIDYRIKRNKAKAIITKTKKESWASFIRNINIKANPKLAWNQINSIWGIKKKSQRAMYR